MDNRTKVSSSQARPSIEQFERAKPQRPAGPPARTQSHYEAILSLLRERGTRGVLGSELYARPDLYGRSPRNRLSEARAAGNLIEGKPYGSSDWHYVLIRENTDPRRRRTRRRWVEQKSLANSPDWFEKQHGPRPSQSDSDLPLFSGVR
jgi:hypothetical protein